MHDSSRLSAADRLWLARTFEVNRSRFGGWTMTQGTPEGGASGDQGGHQDSGGTGDQGGGDNGAQGQQDAGQQGGDQGGSDKGYPAQTPVAEMTAPQQAAYWRDKARTHENRATEYRTAVGGKTADEVRTELDTLRREKMTADERAIEDAKRTERESVAREYGPRSVRTAFDLLLGDMPEQERNEEIELLDLSKFLTSDGNVDTAKVRSHAAKIAPAAKGSGTGTRDFGQGKRGGSAASGTSAGADMFAARKSKSTTGS